MSGFQVYNSAGALTIDSDNKSVVMSSVKAMGTLSDTGYYLINSAFGNGSTLGYLPLNFFPNTGLRWFQLQTNGKYCFPGSAMFEAGSGRFMLSSNTTALTSGYLDVYNSAGTLIWSAASAGTMPRIQDFFTVPSSHDLGTALTITTSFADPWICISQCPGNISDDGESTGYSGVLIKRNSSTSFSLQYVNKNQKTYRQAMGNSGFQIALASFTGY
ncbi:MAG TPA: hypothetical protein VGH05_15805 [Buttiauxella sp.]|jgi:hypothetical protein